jgi:hypothetical protein
MLHGFKLKIDRLVRVGGIRLGSCSAFEITDVARTLRSPGLRASGDRQYVTRMAIRVRKGTLPKHQR